MSTATASADQEKSVAHDTGQQEERSDRGGPAVRSLGLTRPRWNGMPPLGRRAWWAPALLAAVAVVLSLVNLRHDAAAEGGEEARTVVTTHVEELLTYHYDDIDDDLERELAWLDGSFADEYGALVSDKIGPAARKAEVITDATVSASGLVDASSDEVELLLFVNVTTRSKELAAPKTVGSRLVVKASWVDDSWRITSLQPV